MPAGPAERIGRRQLDDQIVGAVHPVAVARPAVERGRQIGRAVIGAAARQDQLLLRPAAHIVVELHEAQRALDRRRAAGGEEDMVEIARRMAGDALGKLGRRLVHRVPGRVVGELHRLVVHDPRQLLAAVADIDAPHAGRPVDQPLAVAVGDVDAVAARRSGCAPPRRSSRQRARAGRDGAWPDRRRRLARRAQSSAPLCRSLHRRHVRLSSMSLDSR